jgi:2-hydroxymuconate-semialdehyde hydrolase
MSSGAVFPGYEVRELDCEGTIARYLEAGEGFPVLLLHGVGPGTSCIGNFRFLLEPLAKRFHVFAMDLIGFGLSDRRPKQPYFDFALWTRQAQMLLERMPAGPVGVLGHSLSGAIALRLAGGDKRVARVLTTGTVGSKYALSRDLERLWTFPESRAELREIMKTIIHDSSRITDAILDERLTILNRGDYPAYFKAMFGPDKQTLMNSWVLSEQELGRISARVVMLHGRNDLPCPAEETTLKLARHLPHADVILLGECSHSPAVEYPEKVLSAALAAFAA